MKNYLRIAFFESISFRATENFMKLFKGSFIRVLTNSESYGFVNSILKICAKNLYVLMLITLSVIIACHLVLDKFIKGGIQHLSIVILIAMIVIITLSKKRVLAGAASAYSNSFISKVLNKKI